MRVYVALLLIVCVSTPVALSAPRQDEGPPPTADLQIQSFGITDAAGVETTEFSPGQTFRMDTRVRNIGRTASRATTLRYYFSTDIDGTAAPTEINSAHVAGLSGRGASANRRRADFSKHFTVPDTPGVYTYQLCVDAVVEEIDTANNCSEGITLTVVDDTLEPAVAPVAAPGVIQGPDLVFSAARVEESIIQLGWGVKLHVAITNQGTATAPSTFLRFYRSTDATISAEDTELRAVRISQLGAGRSLYTWASLVGPTALGTYYYGACVDSGDAEVDTANNCSDVFEITVKSQGSDTPGLLLVGTIPTQFLGSDPVELDVVNYFLGRVEHYTATSSEPDRVSVSVKGSELTLTPGDRGWSTVAVFANRGTLAAKQTFFVSTGGASTEDADAPDLSTLVPSAGSVDTTPVSIPDTALQHAIRTQLGLSAEVTLTRHHLSWLTLLNIGTHTTKGTIADLTGLEWAINLRQLLLHNQVISDITPLRNLNRLTLLHLDENSITDIRPLAGLTTLQTLNLSENTISDLTSLARLTNVDILILNDNAISDVTSLGGLRSLDRLELNTNEITDIASLTQLTRLRSLDLTDNDIATLPADLTPMTVLLELFLAGNPIATGTAEAHAPLRALQASNPDIRIDITVVAGAPALLRWELSVSTAVLPNYPNPFNPETYIPYILATPAEVSVAIYDVCGILVRQLSLGHQAPGFYQSRARAAYWDGRNQIGEKVASGLYFYVFTAADFSATRKMLIRK